LQDKDTVGGGGPTKAEEKDATATKHMSLSPVDPKARLLTRNIAEMMDLAENYEKSMEELNLKVQQMSDEILHLKDELQHASVRAEQQTSDINAKARENSILEKKLEQKQLEIIASEKELQLTKSSEACLSQQLKEQQELHQLVVLELQYSTQQLRERLREKELLQEQLSEQQDQHRQVEMRLQQEIREVQQQLREAADARQQFQARIETAFAYMRGDPGTSQVGFDAIELWEVPREDVHISNKILGTGGWGYVAEGTFRGQKVAVKCLHRGILSQFTTNHVRREISIMAQVRHPNLVLLIGVVLNADTGPLIITELLDRTLRSAYEDHALQERCKFPILRDIASALNYLHAHRRPIIHRDVSSSNILLLSLCNGNWLAKLSDFGSANLIRAATTPAEGAVIYSAPEVSTDQRIPQTTKVDVYSFGVLICEVTLCRLPPDPKDFPGYLDTLERDADDRIYQLAKNCTKRNPDERLTMQEVLERIDQFL
jgi:ubiquitin thioesterase CYLD